jgi:hypothetical protein
MKKETYAVDVFRPENVSPYELAHYIRVAVERWGGGLDPRDPLFGGPVCSGVARITKENGA